MRTWLKWVIAAVVVIVVAVVAGPFIYINFIKDDPPERFSLDDPGAAAATTNPPPVTTAPPATSPATVAAVAPAPTSSAAPGSPSGIDGTWTVVPATSAVGYRVVEVLFGQDTEGVGRTSSVTGELTLAGAQVTAASFQADMTTVVSDERNRDRQFQGNLMNTAEFPTATFTLTTPIELGSVPVDGTPVTASATGDLTLRGATRPVTLEVQAQKNADTLQVVGSTDIVFADYGIPMPDAPGITTQDHGLLEFDLHFTRA